MMTKTQMDKLQKIEKQLKGLEYMVGEILKTQSLILEKMGANNELNKKTILKTARKPNYKGEEISSLELQLALVTRSEIKRELNLLAAPPLNVVMAYNRSEDKSLFDRYKRKK